MSDPSIHALRTTFILTSLALIAFAGNSVFARLALVNGAIDPGSFTILRLWSGAVVLLLIAGLKGSLSSGSWPGGISLLVYAGLFALAYLNLSTAMGALLLFVSVQITMIGWGLFKGETLSLWQIVGLIIACVGLLVLLSPGLERPNLWAALLMMGSGVAWGVYSLLGRGEGSPVQMSSGNFLRAGLILLPIALLVWTVQGVGPLRVDGVLYALISGAITSALGYVIWYQALKGLSAARAGVVQLLVPPLAALGGILFLGEMLTGRFLGASAIILLGIALAMSGRYRNSK